MTEKLLMYAVGRETKYYDMPVVRAVMRDAARESLPVLPAGAGHREERPVSNAGQRAKLAVESSCQLLTEPKPEVRARSR